MLTSNFTQQSVFIVGEGSLLDDGVTQLLTTKTNSLVSRAIHSDEFSIKSNQSNVILICESGSMDVTHILDLIFSHPMTAHYDHPTPQQRDRCVCQTGLCRREIVQQSAANCRQNRR